MAIMQDSMPVDPPAMDLFPTNKAHPGPRKMRGGYYTPIKLAQYLCSWAMRGPEDVLLEPSSGDGNFVVPMIERLRELSGNVDHGNSAITAVEIDPQEHEKARLRVSNIAPRGASVSWLVGDFFELFSTLQQSGGYTAILGNPPFIRFQHFSEESRDKAFRHLRNAGYHPTRLANAWCAFIQLSIELLRPNGRLAMVVPAEFLQVSYADELRRRIGHSFATVTIIGFRKLVFPDIQQEVVLLLCDGKLSLPSETTDIQTIEYEDGQDLLASRSGLLPVKHHPTKLTQPGIKWTALFLSGEAFSAIERVIGATGTFPLGHFASVDVGVVSGNNAFFVLDEAKRGALRAERYVTPVVGRTSAVKSILFDHTDFASFVARHNAFLLDLASHALEDLPTPLQDYVTSGERDGVHLGYKCRVRKKWYVVPSIYIPDAFMFRQIHKYPLLSINRAHATSTDTIHRVRFRNGANPDTLAALAFNSLTLAWAEVAGRSYGGGLLELEPSEAELLPVPYSDSLDVDSGKVDDLLRSGREIQALDYIDRIALKGHLGLDDSTIAHLRDAWVQLRDRRITRK